MDEATLSVLKLVYLSREEFQMWKVLEFEPSSPLCLYIYTCVHESNFARMKHRSDWATVEISMRLTLPLSVLNNSAQQVEKKLVYNFFSLLAKKEKKSLAIWEDFMGFIDFIGSLCVWDFVLWKDKIYWIWVNYRYIFVLNENLTKNRLNYA